MALCNITGTVYLPDGTLAVEREIVFRRVSRNITPEYLGAVLPDDIIAVTDASGNIEVDLLTGSYMAFADGQPNDYFGKVNVPDAASATFAEVLSAPPPPAPNPQWYEGIVEDIESLKQASSISSAQFGSPLNGVDDDAPAIQAAMDFAVAEGIDRVIVSGSPFVTSIAIPGNIDVTFEGPVTALTETDFTVTVKQDGTVQRNSVVRGLNLIGNDLADGGVLLTAAQYWSFYDTFITGYSKPGAWAFVMSGNEINQNAAGNQLFNSNFTQCSNLLKFGKNPEIVGSQNTGASFNTVYGGFFGPYGDNTENVQRGVWVEVGEGNKFINLRVTTQNHHTINWDVMDARTQLIGCAGDGPCFTAFVYPLTGPGSVDSVTLLGVPLLTTPVAWAGTRAATSAAIVAQIEADGNQYPATEFRSMAIGEQVMFFRVDADGNNVRVGTNEIASISVVTSGGLIAGNSSINMGLLQAEPYRTAGVDINKWGYRTGHGGVWEVYGVYFRANPEGSGRASGSLYEPEGNGPENLIWFDDEVTQSTTNVIQANATVHGGQMLSTDASMINLDNNIQAVTTTGNVTMSHTRQRLRTINFGPMVFAEIDLIFTPTITLNGALYIEMPQKPGVYNTTAPLDVNGLQYMIPARIRGTTETQPVFFTVFGGQTSPNGHPFARLIRQDGSIMSTSTMTTGTQVQIQAWGNWPVNRFV